MLVVLVAAVYDVRYRRIPNWLSISGVLAGSGLNSFMYAGWPGLKLSLLGLLAGFGVYFLLYALRATGAGDVKLMAAAGVLIGWRLVGHVPGHRDHRRRHGAHSGGLEGPRDEDAVEPELHPE